MNVLFEICDFALKAVLAACAITIIYLIKIGINKLSKIGEGTK